MVSSHTQVMTFGLPCPVFRGNHYPECWCRIS